MGFMDSARGHLLRFLWKQRQGMFLDMTLDDLKMKLVSRGTVVEKDFTEALSTLADEKSLDGEKLTDAGADSMATEYKQYLTEAAKTVLPKARSMFTAAQVDFDVMHTADVAAREAKEVVNP
jgi:hypothetical protein